MSAFQWTGIDSEPDPVLLFSPYKRQKNRAVRAAQAGTFEHKSTVTGKKRLHQLSRTDAEFLMKPNKGLQPGTGKRRRASDRRERLGMALRANLKRRKQQIRKRRKSGNSEG